MNDLEGQPPLRARFGPFRLDEAEALLVRGDEQVVLPPRAFQVLCALVRRPGQLVTKDALLDAVWGHRHINESALKNIVSQLRQALGDDAQSSRYIQTAARRGYRFIEPLLAEAPAGEPAAALPPLAAQAVQPSTAPQAAPPAAAALVGRAPALAELQAALAQARAGQRQLVFVLGEAGLGKSALIEHFAASCGARVAFAQCIEHYGSGEAYMPVLDALNALCRAEGGAAVVDAMRAVAPTWLLQLPWFVGDEDRRNLQREAAGATQDRMLREFGELADGLAREAPFVLVLEDLHWSDGATVQLLGYLARRRSPAALMVVGSFRPVELMLEEHPLARLRVDLRRHRLCREVDLEPLSEADIGAWLARRLGGEPPLAFVRRLHDQTGGVPLFLAGVVDELLASGRLKRLADGWHLPAPGDTGVPRSIADVIDAQLARLAPGQLLLLGAASVCGVEFQDVPLASVLQLAQPAVQAALADIEGRLPWVRSVGADVLPGDRIAARHAFSHAMYRQVLYERLAPAQRLQWHRAWAAALTEAHGDAAHAIAAELALHHERGEAPVAAAQQLVIVAGRALERSAAQEALRAVRRGLQLGADRLGRALELELRLGEALALSRLHVISELEVATAFARARALGPVEGPAWSRVLHGAWWVHYARAEFGAARELAAEMLRLGHQASDPSVRLTALNALGLVQMASGELAGARDDLQAAIEIHAALADVLPPSQFVQDPGVEARAAGALLGWMMGEPAAARLQAQRAIELAAANRHPVSLVTALTCAAILHSYAGEFDAVRALTERLQAVASEQSLPPTQGDGEWLHGRALVENGQVEAGLAEMRAAARSVEATGMRLGVIGFHYQHAEACRVAGRHEEARASIAAGLRLVEASGAQQMLSPLLRLQGQDCAEAGDTAGAQAALGRAVEVARSQGAGFFELAALAAARRACPAAAAAARLEALLRRYDGDPSPVVLAARSG
jgi:DNA-binding winged helix-turn-helix (wHTH) protein